MTKEFLDFKSLERTSGAAISKALLETRESLNIQIHDCRGQGVSAMSSAKVGSPAETPKQTPKAIYTHCAGHCLNLVIPLAFALTPVRNMIDKVKEVCIFFSYSPKRNGLLHAIIQDQYPENSRKKPLTTLCTTT